MDFSFRVPFRLPPDQRIIWNRRRFNIHVLDFRSVWVEADGADEISTTDRLSMRGTGFASELEAKQAGERWIEWLALGLIDLLIGMNMGQLKINGGGASDYLLAQLNAQDPERQVLSEHTGLLVFPTEPIAVFVGMDADGTVGKRAENLVQRTLQARDTESRLTSKLMRASNVYALAMALPTDESRFITIMTAIEGLLRRDSRPPGTQILINSFIEQLNDSMLEADERQSLNSALEELKLISIGRSGRLMSLCLEDREYLGKAAPKFWSQAYTLRSTMSHGDISQELLARIRTALPALQWFFRDLLLHLAQPMKCHAV